MRPSKVFSILKGLVARAISTGNQPFYINFKIVVLSEQLFRHNYLFRYFLPFFTTMPL